jgi:hypothetical protein
VAETSSVDDQQQVRGDVFAWWSIVAVLLWVAALLVQVNPRTAATVLVATLATGVASSIVPRSRWWVLLPLYYVWFALTAGAISKPYLDDRLGNVSSSTAGHAAMYLSVIVVAVLVFVVPFAVAEPRRRAPSPSPEFVRHALTRLAVLFLGVGMLGAVAVLGGRFPSIETFLSDPQSSRLALADAGASPYAWLAFRFLFLGAVFGVMAAELADVSRRRRLALQSGVTVGCALVYASYGGRLLPATVVIAAVATVAMMRGKLRFRLVAVVLVVAFLLSSYVAAYRYFAFFDRGVSVDRYVTTVAAQSSGEFGDGSDLGHRTSAENARDVLTGQVSDSLPGPAADLIPSPPRVDATFGRFASRALGQDNVGGIRVGAVGEATLAYGAAGAVATGIVIGMTSFFLVRRRDGSVLSTVLSVVISIQVLMTLILGLQNAVYALAVIATCVLSVWWIESHDSVSDPTPLKVGSVA